MNKNNIKNLKSNFERTPSERKLLASKAGKKSGEVRKKRKLLKEELLYLLSIEDKNGYTMQQKACLSLINSAINGNIRAFEVIRNTIGETISEKIETINSNIDITDETIIEEVYRKIKEL